MKRLVLICLIPMVCLMLLALPQGAKADVINFDDRPNASTAQGIPNPYQGFNWSGFQTYGYYYQSGWHNGSYPTPPIAAVDVDGNTSISADSGLFNFQGAYFSSFLVSGGYVPGVSATELTITGWRNGNMVGSPAVINIGAGFSYSDVPINGIDTLSIVATNGVLSGSTKGYGFLMDNFTYSAAPVPLPSAVLLFGSGIAGLAAFGRRFRRS